MGANWTQNRSEVYQFLTADFRETCSEADYIEYMDPVWAGLKSHLGIDVSQNLTVSVTEVSVDGTTGLVETEMGLGGEPLGGTIAGAPWVFKANKWSPTIDDATDEGLMLACSRGALYSAMDKHQIIMEDFNEDIRLNPDDTKPYNRRGAIYRGLGQYQTAIADLTKAIQLDLDYAEAYYNRTFAYQF